MSASTVSKLYTSHTLKTQVKPMQLYGAACALYKEALSLISAPKINGKGEEGKETNHTGLIELSTCGLYESKLLLKKVVI